MSTKIGVAVRVVVSVLSVMGLAACSQETSTDDAELGDSTEALSDTIPAGAKAVAGIAAPHTEGTWSAFWYAAPPSNTRDLASYHGEGRYQLNLPNERTARAFADGGCRGKNNCTFFVGHDTCAALAVRNDDAAHAAWGYANASNQAARDQATSRCGNSRACTVVLSYCTRKIQPTSSEMSFGFGVGGSAAGRSAP